MANTTVYPFGTGGSLPSNIGLINDLITGGADKALTAEQGKELNNMIQGGVASEAIDLSLFPELDNVIGSSKAWYFDSSYAPRNSIAIPLNNYHKIKVVTSGHGAIALLHSLANRTVGGAADFSVSYPDRIISDDSTLEFNPIPSDANYLYIQTRFADGEDIRSRYIVTTEAQSSGVVFREEVVDNLNSEAVYAPLSAKQGKVLNESIFKKMKGKKLAVIGDSISTIYGGNTPYITIKAGDVGNTIYSYVTWPDVYGDRLDESGPTGKTIGGVTLTKAMIDGQLHSFTPVLADVGKQIGCARNYNADGLVTWAQILCEKTGMTLLANASWSGSTITTMNVEARGDAFIASHAWHPCTIGRCKVRDDSGNEVTPDVIIVYRGTNDFSYGNNGDYPTLRISDVSLLDGFTETTDKVGESTYDFRTGYYLTVKALREAYPNAIIILCTLNVFKRVYYDVWPTRNDAFTLPDINNAIREIANVTGCPVIELDKDGVTFENCYPTYISDNAEHPTHPNANGHRVMAEKAVADLTYALNPTS